MKKIKLSYNHKNEIIHITCNYKNLDCLDKIFSLLNMSFLTVVTDYEHNYEKITEIAADKIFDVIKKLKNNIAVVYLLFFDGLVSEIKVDCEISHLTDGLIRFFIAVEYAENEIHILINNKKYDNILDKIKNLKFL